ncbi:DNA gyrase C-terminal beta-propeller domain-containing protein [Acinetobacter baumannii]
MLYQRKVYRLKVFEVLSTSRGAKGRPIVNLLPLDATETVTAILPLTEFPENHYVFMATASGTVKRVELEQFVKTFVQMVYVLLNLMKKIP